MRFLDDVRYQDRPAFRKSRNAIASPESRDVVQWSGEEITVDPSSPFQGKWKAPLVPYLLQPMLDFATGIATDINFRKCAQSAVTQAYMNCLLWLIRNQPAPSMWVTSTGKVMEKFIKGRLEPTMQKCKPVAELMPEGKGQKNVYEIYFLRMLFCLTSAGSIGELQSFPFRNLFMDEVRDWPKGSYDLVLKRTRAFSRIGYRRVTISCPEDEGDIIDLGFKAGNQNHWQFKCKKCGLVQKLKFSWGKPGAPGLNWRNDEYTKPNGQWHMPRVMDSVYFECQNQNCKHWFKDVDSDRQLIYDKGLWIPDNPNAPETSVSYQVSALLPKWVLWGDIVQEFINAMASLKYGHGQKFKDFVTQTLGEPMKRRQEAELAIETTRRGTYNMLELAPGYNYLFLTIDQQKDRFVCVARQWDVMRSRLFWEGEFATADQVKEFQEKWGIEGNHVSLDVGWNQTIALRICAKYGWTAFKGDKGNLYPHYIKQNAPPVYRIYSSRRLMDAWIGTAKEAMDDGKGLVTKPDDDGATLYIVPYFLFSNFQTKSRLLMLRNDPNPDVFSFARDASERYFDELEGEVLMEVINERTGARHEEFMPVTGKDNHAFDCEVAQVVLASMAGLVGAELAENEAERAKREQEKSSN